MSILDSLLVGVLGLSIVFIVLITLNIMIKVLSVSVNSLKKKPAE